LERAGYAGVPDSPDVDGTVLDRDDMPRAGVWIMPNNTLPGMLENYMSFLIPTGDGLFERAERCVGDIPIEKLSLEEFLRMPEIDLR
jgi:hypothetical protein